MRDDEFMSASYDADDADAKMRRDEMSERWRYATASQ